MSEDAQIQRSIQVELRHQASKGWRGIPAIEDETMIISSDARSGNTVDPYDDLIKKGKVEIGTRLNFPTCRDGDIRIPKEHKAEIGSLILAGILNKSIAESKHDPCNEGPDCDHYKNLAVKKFCQECGKQKTGRL